MWTRLSSTTGKIKSSAFIRNHTSGTAPMDMGNIAPGQPQVPGVGGSSQNVSSCLNGWAVNYPDLNNYEHGSHWGQDHFGDNGDVDASGGLNGELYGLQKGKGAKGEGVSFDDICFNCGEPGQGIRRSSVSQKVVRAKDRHKAKRETVKVGTMKRVGQLGRVGQMGKVVTIWAKGWDQHRPTGMNNLEHDLQKEFAFFMTEASMHGKMVEDNGGSVPVKHVTGTRAGNQDDY